jgi:hypothetical protein
MLFKFFDLHKINFCWSKINFWSQINLPFKLKFTILKGTHTETIPARFGLIWFSGFREEDLNVIFYQNMPNLRNWCKSTEIKISHKKIGIYVKLLIVM